MTKYKTKIQYVSWNEDVKGSVKKAEVKKTKLENQGYNHVNSWVEYPDVWVSKYKKNERKQ